MDVRFIRYKGEVYLLREDVVKYLVETADCEESDTRRRLEEGADHLMSVGQDGAETKTLWSGVVVA